MRKLITAAFVSLDGVMQAPGGPDEDPSGGFDFGGWVWPYADEFFGKAVDALFEADFELLLGRKTYEIFAAHWPFQAADDSIANRFNAVRKYVATRSGTPLTWKDSVALHDAATDVARLKQGDGPKLITQGSCDLIQTLLAHELIDELRVFTFPVVLGRGKRLFGANARPGALKVLDHKVSATGVTMSIYQRDGAVRTGNFAVVPPSELELARRERVRHEG